MTTSKKTPPPLTPWEVLSEGPTGRRAVHRVDAVDEQAARQTVADRLAHGHEVIDAAPPGNGVGSRDRDVPTE